MEGQLPYLPSNKLSKYLNDNQNTKYESKINFGQVLPVFIIMHDNLRHAIGTENNLRKSD